VKEIDEISLKISCADFWHWLSYCRGSGRDCAGGAGRKGSRPTGGAPQIASISVGPDQTLTYPVGAPASPYLLDFPDEHTTIIPPASSSAPYLLFGASAISTAWGGTVALQSTDLQTFTFATGLGYSPQVMASPVAIGLCNPSYATEFDENYASQGFVGQDPTLPAGNMIMVYEAENHCVGGVNSTNGGLFSVGFTRSSDNGKTWPLRRTVRRAALAGIPFSKALSLRRLILKPRSATWMKQALSIKAWTATITFMPLTIPSEPRLRITAGVSPEPRSAKVTRIF